MIDGLSAVFWGVVTFSLLVVIHEGGHFLAARAFGVKVHEFMVGLPGPALRIKGKKTTYGITAIPLGGYVRIAGMEPGPEEPLLGEVLAAATRLGVSDAFSVAEATGIPEADAEALLVILADWGALEQVEGDRDRFRSLHVPEQADDPKALLDQARSITYRALSTPKRIVLLAAGVVLNLLTAVLVFTVVLSAFGYLKDTGRIGHVRQGSAAANAGIVKGDRLTSIGGVTVNSFEDLVMTVARYTPGQSVAVSWEHAGSPRSATVVFTRNPHTRRAFLGVSPEMVATRPNPLQALLLSFGYIGVTAKAIAGLFSPVTFQATVSQSSSVIGAAVVAAKAAKAGPLDYAGIVAALSLSLGVINIVPIPPLDGGKVAVELVERFRGRPLPRRFSLGLSATGAAVLFALIGYLMYADIVKMIG